MVVKDARTQEEFGAKLVIELLAKGVNVLELIVGGIENLPQAETK